MTLLQYPRIALLALAALALSAPALADVSFPGAEKLEARLATPHLVNRVDQYCAFKRVDAACELPGTVFDGGGPGRCRREGEPTFGLVHLTCRPTDTPVIDRQLPAGAKFVIEGDFCAQRADPLVAQILALPDFACRESGEVFRDRFCRDKRSGDSCEVVTGPDDQGPGFSGRCAVIQERRPVPLFERYSAMRRFVGCAPATPPPAHDYRRASFFRRLFLR